MARSADEPTIDPTVLAHHHARFDLTHVTPDHLGGPQTGDAAPDFTATDSDGSPVRLSDFRGRTVVLETCTATCPMYIKNIDAMNALADRFPEAAFLVLHTREAHPGENIGPHRTRAGRIRGARLIAVEENERRPVVLDDLSGTTHRAYGAMPDTVHIIDASGTVVFRALWNDPAATEQALRHLAEGRSPHDVRPAGFRPSPAAHQRAVDRARPQEERDFTAARPALHHTHGNPGAAGPGFRHEDLYTSPPPWDIGRPQPAFAALAEAGALQGRVLDIGCGTGEHALMAAGLGLDATGVDLAANALATARHKARDRKLTARFVRHDALKLAEFGESFDTVLDSGLFHVFTGDDRAAYVHGLRSALTPGGRFFHLGFSDREPGPGTHHQVHGLSRDEIEAAFTDRWRIDSIEPATLDIATDPHRIRAWLVTATRT